MPSREVSSRGIEGGEGTLAEFLLNLARRRVAILATDGGFADADILRRLVNARAEFGAAIVVFGPRRPVHLFTLDRDSIHPETLEAIIARGGDGMKELTAADGIPVAISRSLSSAEAMVALGWARELHSIAKERFP